MWPSTKQVVCWVQHPEPREPQHVKDPVCASRPSAKSGGLRSAFPGRGSRRSAVPHSCYRLIITGWTGRAATRHARTPSEGEFHQVRQNSPAPVKETPIRLPRRSGPASLWPLSSQLFRQKTGNRITRGYPVDGPGSL